MSLISDVCEKQPLLDFLSPPDEKDTEIILERVLSDLHAGQLSFVNDTETEILGLCAGYGSGKTRSLLAKCLHLSLLNQGFTGIVLEPTQPLVRDLFVTEFEEFLLNYEIPYTFRSSPLPDFVLHLPKGDTRIMCRSFESWQRIIGINAAFILADEIDTVTKQIVISPSRKSLDVFAQGMFASSRRRPHLKVIVGSGKLLEVMKQKKKMTES